MFGRTINVKQALLVCSVSDRLGFNRPAQQKTYPIFRFQIENLTVFILSADKIRMQRTQYRCMVFNQIGLKPVCSTKSNISSILFSDKEATDRMVSHNKEADQTVKTQYFPAGKTLTGLPSHANI